MMLYDIGQYLEEQGIGALGTDMFIGRFPDVPDECFVLFEYEGREADSLTGTETPGLRVAARSRDNFDYALQKLKSVHDALKMIGVEHDDTMASGIVINNHQYLCVQSAYGGVEPSNSPFCAKRIAYKL